MTNNASASWTTKLRSVPSSFVVHDEHFAVLPSRRNRPRLPRPVPGLSSRITERSRHRSLCPLARRSAVKAMEHRSLRELDAAIILANTYHLYLRPGTDVLKQMGRPAPTC